MASLDCHFLSAPALALLQGKVTSPVSCFLIQFWQAHLYGQLSKQSAKRALQGLMCPCPHGHEDHPHEDGAVGPWDSTGPAGRSLGPCCSSAELHGSNPPMSDFLLLACVLLCLPRAPNRLANSVCGERSPRVISGRIPPLYSWLINSGYRVRMSYRLQECPPQREVNITARAGSPFLWQ